jgi:hypothetical protein
MDDLRKREGERLNLKVVYEGNPFLIEGVIESVKPFISMTVEKEIVRVLKTKETIESYGIAKIPFMWKAFGIQVICEEYKIEEIPIKDSGVAEDREILKGVLYENAWITDGYNVHNESVVREMFAAIYGDKVAREFFPKIESEQRHEEKIMKKSWIKK